MINELLGIKYPIIQGGMANIATGAFAAAVSNLGCMGIIGAGSYNELGLRREIQRAKSLTDKPFGVNLMLLNPKIKGQVEVVVEEKVPLVTTGAGNPGAFLDRLQGAGIKVFPVVSSSSLAKRLERQGVDGIIAEGTESGGHIGSTTTPVLLADVLSQTNLPVVAAGGLALGRQLYSMEVLGAQGFQLGTLFLATDECPIHQNYKDILVKAKARDIGVTGQKNKVPVRLYKNKMVKTYEKREAQGASFEELESYTLGSLRKAVQDGCKDEGSFMMGQCACLIKDILPLKDRIEELVEDYKNAKLK